MGTICEFRFISHGLYVSAFLWQELRRRQKIRCITNREGIVTCVLTLIAVTVNYQTGKKTVRCLDFFRQYRRIDAVLEWQRNEQ